MNTKPMQEVATRLRTGDNWIAIEAHIQQFLDGSNRERFTIYSLAGRGEGVTLDDAEMQYLRATTPASIAERAAALRRQADELEKAAK